MEKGHFVDNFRKLLKRFYLDLFQSANTNLEHATVHLLRSRWIRVRIAQDIAGRSSRKSDEFEAQLIGDMQEADVNIDELESWIAGNSGLAPPQEPQHITSDDSEDGASESYWEEEERNVGSDLLPNVTEMENFLFQGNSFRSLITNTRLFLLPASLGPLSRVLMTIPYDKISFSSENNTSVVNRVKAIVEEYTEENWNWWPLRPRMRSLEKEVYWTCVRISRYKF